jgi:hypothetical protein
MGLLKKASGKVTAKAVEKVQEIWSTQKFAQRRKQSKCKTGYKLISALALIKK